MQYWKRERSQSGCNSLRVATLQVPPALSPGLSQLLHAAIGASGASSSRKARYTRSGLISNYCAELLILTLLFKVISEYLDGWYRSENLKRLIVVLSWTAGIIRLRVPDPADHHSNCRGFLTPCRY